MERDHVFLRACRREHTEYTPVWVGGDGVEFDNDQILNPTVTFTGGVAIYEIILYALHPAGGTLGSDTIMVTLKNQQLEVDAGSYPPTVLSGGTAQVHLAGAVAGGVPASVEWVSYSDYAQIAEPDDD